MIKKILLSLFILFGFISFSNASFNLVSTGNINNRLPLGKYNINISNRYFVENGTQYMNMGIDVYFSGNLLSTCHISGNRIYQQGNFTDTDKSIFIINFEKYYGIIIKDGRNKKLYYFTIQKQGNCNFIAGFTTIDTDLQKMQLGFAKGKIIFTDVGNSNNGLIINPAGTGSAEITTGLQTVLQNLGISTLLNVGVVLPAGKNYIDFTKVNKLYYGVYQKDLGNTNKDVLNLYNNYSFLSYVGSTENLKKRIVGTGNNILMWGNNYNILETGNNYFTNNIYNGILQGVINYHYIQKYYGIMKDIFVYDYLGKYYSDKWISILGSENNYGSLYYDNVNYKLYDSRVDTGGVYHYKIFNLLSNGSLHSYIDTTDYGNGSNNGDNGNSNGSNGNGTLVNICNPEIYGVNVPYTGGIGFLNCSYSNKKVYCYQKMGDTRFTYLFSGFTFIPKSWGLLDIADSSGVVFYGSGVQKVFTGVYRFYVSDDCSLSSPLSQGTLQSPIVLGYACPISGNNNFGSSIMGFKIGGWSILGFHFPEVKPFGSFACLFNIVGWGINVKKLPFGLDLFSGGQNLIPDSAWGKLNSNYKGLGFGDIFIFLLIVSVFILSLIRK